MRLEAVQGRPDQGDEAPGRVLGLLMLHLLGRGTHQRVECLALEQQGVGSGNGADLDGKVQEQAQRRTQLGCNPRRARVPAGPDPLMPQLVPAGAEARKPPVEVSREPPQIAGHRPAYSPAAASRWHAASSAGSMSPLPPRGSASARGSTGPCGRSSPVLKIRPRGGFAAAESRRAACAAGRRCCPAHGARARPRGGLRAHVARALPPGRSRRPTSNVSLAAKAVPRGLLAGARTRSPGGARRRARRPSALRQRRELRLEHAGRAGEEEGEVGGPSGARQVAATVGTATACGPSLASPG